jgi:hypothetical protein
MIEPCWPDPSVKARCNSYQKIIVTDNKSQQDVGLFQLTKHKFIRVMIENHHHYLATTQEVMACTNLSKLVSPVPSLHHKALYTSTIPP